MTATVTTAGATAVEAPPGRRRRSRLRIVLTTLGVVLLVLAVGWLSLFSSVLAVHRVTVVGARELTPDKVKEAAAVPVGRPLLRLDLVAIARRTAQVPQVASAEVTRDWPQTVRVTVVERKPVLAIRQPAGFLMVDQTGLAYENRSAVPTGVVTADVNVDDRALLTQVGVVAHALPADLRQQVRRVSATTPDNIALTLDSGVVVTWGNSADSALKAEVTMTLLDRKPKATVDVSSPHNPALR